MEIVTPSESSFEDITEANAFVFDYMNLTPVTPEEADFSDVVPEKNINLIGLAPVTPLKADINEPLKRI